MSEPTTPGTVSSNRSIMIVLSYLWLLALVPLLVEKDDKEVQWHAKHGIVLMVAEIVLWIAITIVTLVIQRSAGAGLRREPAHVRPLDRHPRGACDGHHQGRQRRAFPDPRGQRVRQQVLIASCTTRDSGIGRPCDRRPAGSASSAPARLALRPERLFLSLLVLFVVLLGADLSRAAGHQVSRASARMASTSISARSAP